MKALMFFTGSGPLLILTSHASATDPGLLEKLRAKGIDKFIAHELPVDAVRERYGGHFQVVTSDLRESDDCRVLDFNGERVFRIFRLGELGPPIVYDPSS
jgi:hypothetical protein